MDRLDHHRRLFAYDAWANRQALASLETPAAPPPRALGFLAHILAAEELWLVRLRQEKTRVVVWPELSLAKCEERLNELNRRWQDYLGALAPSDLSRSVAYVNSKGEAWSNTVDDILHHVVMHSVYHRGQVAAEVRRAGGTPAYTDFIHWVRQGLG